MTVRELAKLAGVSPATVSLALNGKKGVSEETRELIMQLAQDNEYIHTKKSGSKSRNILFVKYTKHGLIVEENRGFITTVMDAAELECRKHNFKLIVTGREGSIADTLRSLHYTDFYGILFLGTELDQKDYYLLETIPIPYVVIDNTMPNFECNCVAINNRENVYKAIEFFSKMGVQEVGYFKSSQTIQNFTEREEGFFEAMEHFGLSAQEDNVFVVPPTMLGAFEQTQSYIAAGRRIPSCLFIDNDTITIGVMKALTIAGYKIPEDISVIGFDDIPFAEIYSPTISTMRVDKNLLGELAVTLHLHTAANPDYHTVKAVIGGDLITRQSTRPLLS
jgi:LacI family transcriptional regulator